MSCYRQNVDDVSERISNLGITTATENSQPIPRDLLALEAHPPTLLGENQHSATTTTTFLSLPFLVKWHIYTHLHSKDCIALSAVHPSKQSLLRCALCPPTRRGARVLTSLRAGGAHVPYRRLECNQRPRRLRLQNGVRISGRGRSDYTKERTTHLLAHLGSQFDQRGPLLLTNLGNTHTSAHRPQPTPRSVFGPNVQCRERLPAGTHSRRSTACVRAGKRKLRWFAFTILGNRNRGDRNWDMTLQRVTEAATELETLVLESGEHFDANSLGQMLQSGFERGVLGKLRSFSVNTVTLCLSSLRQLFCGFSRSSVTHLRIVVNHYGRWLRDIGPQYIFELAEFVPDLEEISLDQVGMLNVTPLPGDLGVWGEAFRKFKKLRRIVFASMFVLDLYRPGLVDDDEQDDEEDEEEGAREDEDAGMDVDEGDGEGDEGYETDEGRNGGAPEDDTLEANLVLLAAWADMFLDDHLRMLEPFAEIWFVDPRFLGRTAGGFNQRVMEGEGEGGRAEHMIYYPILKRDGWWWDERDPVPLD